MKIHLVWTISFVPYVGLQDEINDESFFIINVPVNIWDILILKKYRLCIWNSRWTGNPLISSSNLHSGRVQGPLGGGSDAELGVDRSGEFRLPNRRPSSGRSVPWKSEAEWGYGVKGSGPCCSEVWAAVGGVWSWGSGIPTWSSLVLKSLRLICSWRWV